MDDVLSLLACPCRRWTAGEPSAHECACEHNSPKDRCVCSRCTGHRLARLEERIKALESRVGPAQMAP
jgi:hypothetical protein